MIANDLIEKTENFSKLPQKEQVKLIAYFYCAENITDFFEIKNLREEFQKNKLDVPLGINSIVSNLHKNKPKIFLKGKNGYSFHRNTLKELDIKYKTDIHNVEVSETLRSLLEKVNSIQQKYFLEEAIKCFEVKAYRASIIMCWLLAMDVLYEFVIKPNNLSVFNNTIQINGKYKKITVSKKDDFSEFKESDFIELLRVSKFISNDIRKILDEKLGIRNTSAHPNSVSIEDYKAIAFIKDITSNIIEKYQ